MKTSSYIAGNGKEILLRLLTSEDLDLLLIYLQQLGDETRRRFGPHGFDIQSLHDVFLHASDHLGYVAIEVETGKIIAYSIVKLGFLEHDKERLRGYGMIPDHRIDCTFAPSVSDAWQSMGVGNKLFQYMLEDLRARKRKRMILWGGVQKHNEKAVHFYLRNHFRILGEFEYNGWNYDMIHLML